MRQLRVFVGSAMDELQFEREAAAETITEVSQWPELFELFPAMSDSPTRAALERIQDADIFVLILYRRYSPPTFDEYREAVARGLPIIAMVRLTSEDREKPIDELIGHLMGRGDLPASIRTVFKLYSTLAQFKKELKEALIYEVGRLLRPPLSTLTREEMYDLGTEMIAYAQRRIAIVQRTPSLFFGARPYHFPNDQKWVYEQRFLGALENWIEIAVQDRTRSVVYAFSASDAQQHIRDQGEEARRAIADRLVGTVQRYKGIEQATGRRLRFDPLRTTISGPMAVCDNRVAFWLMGEDDAVAIQQENRSIANVITRMLSMHTVHGATSEGIIRDLLSDGRPSV